VSADRGTLSPTDATWHPIETAPRDGTRINLRRGDEIACAAYWGFGCHPEPSGSMGWVLAPIHWEPTHWQPIPRAESASAKD